MKTLRELEGKRCVAINFCNQTWGRVIKPSPNEFLAAAGMLVGNHSPGAPVSTTLEPCRVAPYVNVPSIRLPSAYDRLQPFSGFSAFDPALFSAAQQVSSIKKLRNKHSLVYSTPQRPQRSPAAHPRSSCARSTRWAWPRWPPCTKTDCIPKIRASRTWDSKPRNTPKRYKCRPKKFERPRACKP